VNDFVFHIFDAATFFPSNFSKNFCTQVGMYTVLDATASSVMTPIVDKMKDPHGKFQWKRRMEAWKLGSGADNKMPKEMED
jgi:hypothetical protein